MKPTLFAMDLIFNLLWYIKCFSSVATGEIESLASFQEGSEDGVACVYCCVSSRR